MIAITQSWRRLYTITSGNPYGSCSRIGFRSSDLLSLLGIDGIHTDWGDCRRYRADPYVPACTLFNLVWSKTNSSSER